MDDIAPMIVMVTACFTIGAVAILRPISKHLGELLIQMRKERKTNSEESLQLARVALQLEQLSYRLSRIEERQEFTEKLIDTRVERVLPAGEWEGH